MGQRKLENEAAHEQGTPKKRASLFNLRRVQAIGSRVGLSILLCWSLFFLYGGVADGTLGVGKGLRTRWILPIIQPLLNFLVCAFLLQVSHTL
jgi:hypothetical protein